MEHLAGKILATKKSSFFFFGTFPFSSKYLLLQVEKAEAQRPIITTHKPFCTPHRDITSFEVRGTSLRRTLEPALTALPIREQWSCRR